MNDPSECDVRGGRLARPEAFARFGMDPNQLSANLQFSVGKNARGESVVRALFVSTTGLPANVCYPDTGHWLIRNGLGRDELAVRETGPGGANSAGSGVAEP